MLKDPRSDRFVTQFTNQWLDLSSVDRVAVNPEYYEDFDVSLKVEMQKETRAFFSEVLKKDLSALNFLESDFHDGERTLGEALWNQRRAARELRLSGQVLRELIRGEDF